MINQPMAQTILDDESSPVPPGRSGGGRIILASDATSHRPETSFMLAEEKLRGEGIRKNQ